jgi:hypothetical protein
VAFHVEISSGFRQRARAFNLDDQRLRRTILDPWVRGEPIELGDKEWQPRDCKLIILEGPELAETDLSMGRGWTNAERSSRNATRELVDGARGSALRPVVAIIAETPAGEAGIARMLDRLELERVSWSDLRGRLLAAPANGHGPRHAAVLAVESPTPPGSWLFDAGLARGALGSRAVVAQLGGTGIPIELTGLDVIRLDPDQEASLRVLGDRLGS